MRSKRRSRKRPLQNTSLEAQMVALGPQGRFSGAHWGPRLETKSRKMRSCNACLNPWASKWVYGGPQSSQGPKIHSKWYPHQRFSDDFWCMLYCEGTQHTPQSSRDFPVSFASPGRGGVWGGEGGESGETLGDVCTKAPSHFGVHFHTKAGFKKTSQKRPPI